MRKKENKLGVSPKTYQSYLWLLKAANYSGYVCRSQAALTRDLKISQRTLVELLAELKNNKLIQIHNPLPYLVLKLPLWSDKERKARSSKQVTTKDLSGVQQLPAPLLLNRYPSAAAANKINLGEGVQGEGNLADQVVRATGWTDPAEVQQILSVHSPPVIQKALARLAQVPDNQIRTSRIALFRYLIGRFSRNSSDAP